MEKYLEFLRGSVRPVGTYMFITALIVLVFQHPDDLLKDFVLLVTAVVSFWFGGRTKPDGK